MIGPRRSLSRLASHPALRAVPAVGGGLLAATVKVCRACGVPGVPVRVNVEAAPVVGMLVMPPVSAFSHRPV